MSLMHLFRRITLLSLLLFAIPHACAQTGTVRGRVVGGAVPFEKEPILGATVTVVGTPLGCSTDATGNFTIQGLQPNTYLLRTSAIGYQDDTMTVIIPADTMAAADVEIVLPYNWCEDLGGCVIDARGDTAGTATSLPRMFTIQGKVIDRQQNQPLANARISASFFAFIDWAQEWRTGCCIGTSTDSLGNYTLRWFHPGQYALHVCARGYPQSETIVETRLDSLSVVNFDLDIIGRDAR